MKGTSGRKKDNEIKDFSGGLITKSPWKGIETKYSVDCLNVYSEGAVLRPRLGYSTVSSQSAAAVAGNGMFNWWKTGTSQWLVFFTGATLNYLTVGTNSLWNGASITTLSPDSADGTALTNSKIYFATYGSTLIMTTESRDMPQRMTVSDASYFNLHYGGGGTAPKGKYGQVWKTHCWILNCTDGEDRIRRSAIATYSDWTGTDSGYNDVVTPGDIGLTGSAILDGRLYVFKSWSIHRFTYLGSGGPVVDIRNIESSIGTKSPKTIKNINVPGKGDLLIFLGTDSKLYLYDGIDALPISDKVSVSNSVSTVYFDNINDLEKSFATVNPRKNWYELFVCIGTSTTPNYSIVYDYVSEAFWPNDNRNFTDGDTADNGSTEYRRQYVQAPTDGRVYVLDDGNSDNGTAINAYWVSSKVGASMWLSKLDEIEIETASVNCNPVFSWRADWETTWSSVTMSASSYSHNFNPGRVDNLIQFRVADNSTTDRFAIWSIQLNSRAVGGGK